jgi:hypothetical protein
MSPRSVLQVAVGGAVDAPFAALAVAFSLPIIRLAGPGNIVRKD